MIRGIGIQNFIRIGSKLKKLHGSKDFKKRAKIWKHEKNGCFFPITFLFLINHNNIKRIKNSAWYQEPTCQISLENIENWQSYQGLKLWKGCFYWLFPLFFTGEISNKNNLFRTSNLNNFVSFQYFLMKFGMQVPDIKQIYLLSSWYNNSPKTKKLLGKISNFFNFFHIFALFWKLWTHVTCSLLIQS